MNLFQHIFCENTGEKTNKWLTWIGGGIFLVVSVGIFALKKEVTNQND
ncbi:LPXTG cell wall anchor domain-containing protein [Enterococcus hirae]